MLNNNNVLEKAKIIYRLGMKQIVGLCDSGQVLGVLGWALTGIRNLPFVLQCCRIEMSTVLCVEQSCEFFLPT